MELAAAIDHFPESTPIIPFATKGEATQRAVDLAYALHEGRTRNQYLVFADVPQEAMDYWCDNRDGMTLSGRFNCSRVSKIMVLKLVLPLIVDSAKYAWDYMLSEMALRMGTGRGGGIEELHRGYIVQLNFDDMIKQADRWWDHYHRVYPWTGCTIVLEIGLPEAAGRLAFDARQWLETAGSNVHIAITMVVYTDVQKIVIKYLGAMCISDIRCTAGGDYSEERWAILEAVARFGFHSGRLGIRSRIRRILLRGNWRGWREGCGDGISRMTSRVDIVAVEQASRTERDS